MAFAMKLAAKKVDLSVCPYVSDEAKAILGAASEPPVKCVELGMHNSFKLGDETVLYRHEKTFVHQTAIAVNINDTDDQKTVDTTLNRIKEYALERVGEKLRVEMVALTQKGENIDTFVALAKKAWEVVQRPLVLCSNNPEALVTAAKVVGGSRSVLASANKDNLDILCTAAKENGHILAVTAPDLDELVGLTTKLKKEKFNDLILNFQTHSLAEQFQTNSIARRAALKDNFKALGYAHLHFIKDNDIFQSTATAVNEICKYGGICVLPSFNPAQIAALLTLRQNIYTDPQKPIQVEPKIYPIGDPKPNSPVFVTTNFSLTYFIVSGEIENSGISAWLVVPECEGMSVLTAWAAGKFSGVTIAKFVKEIGLEDQVNTREIVIPGYVAQISGELEEGLPGWKAVVGPQEAADIEGFVKMHCKL